MQSRAIIITMPTRRTKEFLQSQFKISDTDAEQTQCHIPSMTRFRFSYDTDEQLGCLIRNCVELHIQVGIDYN